MTNKTAFLFMDECSYENLDLMALTGILIPSEAYSAILEELHGIVWRITKVDENAIPAPVEMHARKFLEDKSDDIKISCLSLIVDVINKYQLNIFRGAYLNHSEIVARMAGDPNFMG